MSVLLKAFYSAESFEMEVQSVVEIGGLVLVVELAEEAKVLLGQVRVSLIVFLEVGEFGLAGSDLAAELGH